MVRGWLWLGAGAWLAVTPAAQAAPPAAPATTVRVSQRGVLVIPGTLLQQLKAKPASDGTFCVQFPGVEAPGHEGHKHVVLPLRVWYPKSRDGSLKVTPRRVGGGHTVPGKAGTRYRVKGFGGKLVLTPI